jgi:general secretion pathway protein G
MNTRVRSTAPGFSMIEIMIVIVIMGLLAGIGIPMYLGYAAQARQSTTKQNLSLIKSQLTLFNLQHGKYPPRLIDLVERPKGEIGKNWTQSFEKLPKDAWAQDFYYKTTAGGKHPYELYSYGGYAGPEEPAESRVSVWDI